MEWTLFFTVSNNSLSNWIIKMWGHCSQPARLLWIVFSSSFWLLWFAIFFGGEHISNDFLSNVFRKNGVLKESILQTSWHIISGAIQQLSGYEQHQVTIMIVEALLLPWNEHLLSLIQVINSISGSSKCESIVANQYVLFNFSFHLLFWLLWFAILFAGDIYIQWFLQ